MEFPIDLLKTFLAIIDTGGVTSAAQVVHRTQSAISMQVKRLEETVGQPLFDRGGRSFALTGEGETLVPYARRMLKLHEEAVAAMIEPEMVGAVRFGTPDDYALRFLPDILTRFAKAFPRVQVAVRCEPSSQLAPALDKGELDLALLTGNAYLDHGEIIRRDPTVWVSSASHLAHEEDPLPLAVFQAECIFRRWTFEALDAINRRYRVAYQSQSVAGILAAVSAGLAVTVLSTSIVPSDARILTVGEGFPQLPETNIILKQSPGNHTRVVECMAGFIRDGFQG
jgi:DNA-binding transcriptional LysR family regulator